MNKIFVFWSTLSFIVSLLLLHPLQVTGHVGLGYIFKIIKPLFLEFTKTNLPSLDVVDEYTSPSKIYPYLES